MQETIFRLEPYCDAEVPEAVQALFAQKGFIHGMQALLPKELFEHLVQVKNTLQSVYDFQKEIIYPLLKLIEKFTIKQLTSSGIDQLNPNEKYLFISNHRDIVLDSAYMNMLLFENGIATSQMAIGDNLIQHTTAELFFRLNKSFIVKRSGGPRELYAHSITLSKYMKDLIVNKESSVWIAQREGRAKDGNDTTQVGLLKMISLAGHKDIKAHFEGLNIIPVSISYEYDPCDFVKTKEFLAKNYGENTAKTFQQDAEHILMGVKGAKGNVHFHFGEPLTPDLKALDAAINSKQQLETLAQLIDNRIQSNYQLHPINYVAADLLQEKPQFEAHYTSEAFKKYSQNFNEKIGQLPENQQEEGRKYLLGMYGNPVYNQHNNSHQ